jgi:hypothetical protein
MPHAIWIYEPARIPLRVGEVAEDVLHLAAFAPNIYTDYARLALAEHYMDLATATTRASAIDSDAARKQHLSEAERWLEGLEGSTMVVAEADRITQDIRRERARATSGQ